MKSGKSAMVDIAPSICRFMDFEVPRDVLWEQDGTSFYGKADMMEMDIMPYDNTVDIRWECLNKRAQVNVWASVSNHFKEGGKDEWIKIGTVPAKSEKYTVDLSRLPASTFYKFVLETPNGTLNRWYDSVPEKYGDFKVPLAVDRNDLPIGTGTETPIPRLPVFLLQKGSTNPATTRTANRMRSLILTTRPLSMMWNFHCWRIKSTTSGSGFIRTASSKQ